MLDEEAVGGHVVAIDGAAVGARVHALSHSSAPPVSGEQLGRRLAERICEEARAAGYRRICLDTLSSMAAALGLYTSMGFKPIEPYVFNPIPGALFLGRDLLDPPSLTRTSPHSGYIGRGSTTSRSKPCSSSSF